MVTIDWDKFDDPDIYLSDVTINYEIRKPQHFISNSGTYMEIQHARTRWNESDVFRISRALRRLMSPFRTPQSFIIKLECPEYPKYTDLDPGELLRTSHAQMTVLVDRSGVAQYDYKFDLEPYPSRKVESQEIDLRKKMKNWDPVDRNSASGEFFVTLYLWDRRSDSLKLSKANPDELNQAFGVSVFRDGIRVMPYGEPDDDWLGIDERRYMRSSGAFGRKNVLGAIEITQIANKNLRDKSNREGFIENDAFIDLRDLMRAIMNIAFNEFAEDRRVIKATEDANKVILPAIRSLENSANSVTETLDQNRLVIQDFVSRGKLDSLIAEQLLANLNPVDNTFKAAVNETRQAAIDTLTTFDEERDMLLSLAGLGLAAERFTHEFARLTREAVDLLREIKRIPQIQQSVEATNSINTLRVTIEALQDLVLALGPMFYIRRRTKEKELNVKIIVEHVLLLNEGQIEDNKIKVELDQQDELVAVMRVGALTQVFNNLIDNACYWLSRKSQENDRCLKITIVAKDKMVIIADNGPGIHPRDRHRIFDPFFSTKVDGRGLGLFISREILAESKAIIELLEPGNHPATFRVGAAFCIRFAD